jgi:hypothetical protein
LLVDCLSRRQLNTLLLLAAAVAADTLAAGVVALVGF